MKSKSAIFIAILTGLLFFVIYNCKKETIKIAPSVTVSAVTDITATSASSGGQVTADGGATVTARGVCWSTTQNPITSNSKTTDGSGTGNFSSALTGLSQGTTYYFKAYAINSVGTGYSDQSTFTTLALAPVLTTSDLTAVTSTSAAGGGNITNDGGASITARGLCWSTSQNPTVSDNKTTDGTGTGSFTSAITGLTAGTTYYVRAYAINSVGTSYGNQVSATTTTGLSTLNTTAISNLTANGATSGGNITSNGGAAVTARGVCWNTSSGPIISNNITTDGSGSGIFTSSISGLLPGTTYYVRAYATNSIGTAYGNELTLTTSAILPVITTTVISGVTSTTVTSGGNITTDGGAAVTARGVCWNTSSGPTISNSKTTDGTGSGSFTSSGTGLLPGTIYYVRAYATNSIGTAYGNELTVTTPAILPVISTTVISAVNSVSATSGGNITSDGGAAVTTRGVCWNTLSGPTASNTNTSDGTGTGSFSSSITGLLPGTTYYVRAYATNSVGTAYGNELTMITPAILPVITTTAISAVTSTTSSSGGNITSDGGAAVTAKGVCWDTSSSPTISNNVTTDGTGVGSFISAITGLTASTNYYVRSYATNSVGTAYGNELTFITLPNLSIEWTALNQGDWISIAHYSGGVIVGEYLAQNFTVLNGSGNIPITVEDVTDNITKTSFFSVEQGKQYKITVTANFSNSGTGTCPFTLVCSSLNCSTTTSIYVTSIPTSYGGHYCPGSLVISDISIAAIN